MRFLERVSVEDPGLSIVKAIMDSMNQSCGVKNFSNGVAFWFTLEDASKE